MKKIFGIIAVGMMLFSTTFTALALNPCSEIVNMPDLYSEWNNLPLAAQQSYISSYCGGSTVSVGSGISANTQIKNPIKYSTFSEFASAVIKTAVQVMMPFIVLAFIYAGFLFVKAQGNEKELEEAKKAITWSMIGAFVLLGAWGFAQIIGRTISTITQ